MHQASRRSSTRRAKNFTSSAKTVYHHFDNAGSSFEYVGVSSRYGKTERQVSEWSGRHLCICQQAEISLLRPTRTSSHPAALVKHHLVNFLYQKYDFRWAGA